MRRFRWTRFRRILFDPTRTAEVLVGLCFVLSTGLLMAILGAGVSSPAEFYLAHYGLTDRTIWVFLVSAGLAQIWGAGTDWYRARGWIAFLIACGALITESAYIAAQQTDRLIVAFLPGIVLAEGFIARRCWHRARTSTLTDQTTDG